MGAWGPGMQSNDTALDAIGAAGKTPLRYLEAHIDEWLTEMEDYHSGMFSILGLSEYCLDKGFKISDELKIKIKLALEVGKKAKEEWNEVQDRVDCLNRFEKRLNGENVDAQDLIIDNMGLLDRMVLHGKSREEIKVLLKSDKKT